MIHTGKHGPSRSAESGKIGVSARVRPDPNQVPSRSAATIFKQGIPRRHKPGANQIHAMLESFDILCGFLSRLIK